MTLDFNRECGDGVSFKKAEQTWWAKCDPEGVYAEFSKKTRQVTDDGSEIKAPPFMLPLNDYGEPMIVERSAVKGLTNTVFYKETIKQYINGHYGTFCLVYQAMTYR